MINISNTVWIGGAIITFVIGTIIMGYVLTNNKGKLDEDFEVIGLIMLGIAMCSAFWPIVLAVGAICCVVWVLLNIGNIIKKTKIKRNNRKVLLNDVNKLMEK